MTPIKPEILVESELGTALRPKTSSPVIQGTSWVQVTSMF